MATLQFRLSTRVSNNRAELLARFYEGKQGFRAKTRIFAICEHFDPSAGRLLVPKRGCRVMQEIVQTNQQIDALAEHIFREWELDRYSRPAASWLQSVIDSFRGVSVQSPKSITLEDAVRGYADRRQQVYNTYKGILSVANALDKYAHPVPIQAVTPEYISALADYLYTIVAPNTAKKMLSTIRSVCNEAVDRELLAHSPFGGSKGYKIGTPLYGSPHYLTADERDRLASFQGLPPKLAVQRDIFIFQCYVGCRVSDLIRLTPANVLDGKWLEYVPKKTSNISARTVRVPLSPVAQDIIARYRHTHLVRAITMDTHTYAAEYVTDPQFESPTLLPFMSAQAYNECIHQFFTLAGLTRQIVDIDKHTGKPTVTTLDAIASSHLARKTFSQQVYSHSGSERIAASFTGHSPNSRAFARYNEVDDAMKQQVIASM